MDDDEGVPCLAWEHMYLEEDPSWETSCLDDSLECGRPNEAGGVIGYVVSFREKTSTSATRQTSLVGFLDCQSRPKSYEGESFSLGELKTICTSPSGLGDGPQTAQSSSSSPSKARSQEQDSSPSILGTSLSHRVSPTRLPH